MSWPTDGRPRYAAASIPGDAGRGGGDKRAIGYVYDRGYCHRIVLEIRDRIRGVALRKADEAASALNAGCELTPVQRGERPHGGAKYKNEGCHCDVCRDAAIVTRRQARERKVATA